MHKTLLFLAFLAAYVGWFYTLLKLGQSMKANPLKTRSIWGIELILLQNLAGFFGFIYLLSGFWNTQLAIILVMALHLGTFLGWFLNNAFGKNPDSATAREFWSGFEIGVKNPVGIFVSLALVVLAALAYPVVAGVLFTRHPWGSAILQEQMVKCTLLLLTASGYLLTAMLAPPMLASENLDGDTRQNLFFSQLGGLIPTAVYGAIAASAYGFDQNAVRFDALGNTGRTVSLELLAIVFAFFLATSLIPYLVGTQRSRVKALQLSGKVEDFLGAIQDILECPVELLYVRKLQQLQASIHETGVRYVSEESIFARYNAIKADPDKATGEEKNLKIAIDSTESLDPRFQYVQQLSVLEEEVKEVIANLEQRSASEMEDAARRWAKRFKNRKAGVKASMTDIENRRPLIAAGIGSGGMVIVSGILGEVAKTAWSLISQGH